MSEKRVSDHIGLAGAGFDVELEIVRETDRAYRLSSEDGSEFWMPKSAFSEDGALYVWAIPLLERKMAGEDD